VTPFPFPRFDDDPIAGYKTGWSLTLCWHPVVGPRGNPTSRASLSLTVPTDAQAQRLFAALAEGGQVQTPLARPFFSSNFGVVADRFGVSWMIDVVAFADQKCPAGVLSVLPGVV
jgi:hypothetical protein